ncbi:MAG: 30S ribosomal protein S19 [Candidatus Altiarchaeales archaeon]|nr:30S ribosomal protein S19 [Candidatus Altiarchaeales archaeon]
MAKKKFNYQGKTVEELKALSRKEYMDLLPSRIRRSLRRGLSDQQKNLLANIKKAQESGSDKPVRTHVRDMPILPEMIGAKVSIYSGKEFSPPIEIKPEMLGCYLGEFMLTRKPIKHSSPGVGATRSSLFVPVR